MDIIFNTSPKYLYNKFIYCFCQLSYIFRKIQQLREEHAEYLAMRKQEALEGQQLMMEIAARKMRQEEKKQDGKMKMIFFLVLFFFV